MVSGCADSDCTFWVSHSKNVYHLVLKLYLHFPPFYSMILYSEDLCLYIHSIVHDKVLKYSNMSSYSTGQRQYQNETRSNAFGGQLKRVCVHHAQVMEGTVERSKHGFY